MDFRVFNEDDGLPQSYIYSISQNEKGFLYVGTGDGFCRYGGYSFESFSTQNGLKENFVTTHLVARDGNIWLGHFQGGISRFDGRDFLHIQGSENMGSKIVSILQDDRGRIFVGTQHAGIFVLDSFSLKKLAGSDAYHFRSLLFDPAGGLLAGTNEGLIIFKITDNNELFLVKSFEKDLPYPVTALTLMKNDQQMVWAAADGYGFAGFKRSQGEYSLARSITKNIPVREQNYTSLICDHNGNLIAGTNDEGLLRMLFPRDITQNPAIFHISKENGLPNPNIRSIYEDKEGNLWVGTFGGGLFQAPFSRFDFFTTADGLQTEDVNALVADKNGKVFLGGKNGIVVMDRNVEGSYRFTMVKNLNASISSLYSDSLGVFAGSSDGKIYLLKEKDDSWTAEPVNFGLPGDIGSINSITRHSAKYLAVGTMEGLFFADPIRKENISVTTTEGLLHNNVISLYSTPAGQLWISSRGAPPYFYQGDEFTAFKEIPGMKSFNILSVTSTSSGTVWIATEGDGVFEYNGQDFQHYGVEEGLLSNYAYFICSDQDGNVWIGHKNGLSLRQRSEQGFRQFTKPSGLLLSEFNLNAITLDQETGDLWAGTSKGLVRIRRTLTGFTSDPPILHLLGVSVNGKNYEPGSKITLAYSKYQVRIDYIGICLRDPSSVQYRYKVHGLDSSWRYTRDRRIDLAGVSDGNYRVEIYASSGEGKWTSTPAIAEFTVGLPFYKTWTFLLFIGLIIPVIVILVIQVRTKALLRSKVILEKAVKEKTSQLQEEKETVERIKTILEEKNKNITDSINYARRIQEALLPTQKVIQQHFPGTLIYYRPRDIVSGDFYWFTETEEFFFIAAVDCTGHGIPGAFMSLIGTTLLDKIVKDDNVYVPGEILAQLDMEITMALKQEDWKSSTRDGMDIALCRIEKKNKKLVFAGAGRPLWLFSGNELKEFKPKTFSLGGGWLITRKEYENFEVILNPGDVLFIFSDGYADQFGGEGDKKFSNRSLKDLFAKAVQKEAAVRYELLDSTFISWKGEKNQFDDILIIGLQIS